MRWSTMTPYEFSFKERDHFFSKGSSTPIPCDRPDCARTACREFSRVRTERAIAHAVRNRRDLQFVTVSKIDEACTDDVARTMIKFARTSLGDLEAAWVVEPHKGGLVHIHMMMSFTGAQLSVDAALLTGALRSRDLLSVWSTVDVQVCDSQTSALSQARYITKNAKSMLPKHLTLNAGHLVRATRSFFTAVGGKRKAATAEGRMSRLFAIAARKYGALAVHRWFADVRNYEDARRAYALALKANPPFAKFTSERFDFPPAVRSWFAAFGLDWSDISQT